jgi:pimeloyl-ACP methyl ester carboxylesterase
MTSIGIRVIRAAFGVGERVAPKVSGRIAFELFCRTPSPASLSQNERRAVERAKDFMAEARHHQLKSLGGCVVVHEFRPVGERVGTVLVIHGWRSRTEYMHAIIKEIRDAGYRVVSVDLPGHGASAGRRLDMAKAVDAARVAGEWFGPFAAVVGHSFGGAVAVNAAAGSVVGVAPIVTDKLVLISAPESLPAVFADFGNLINAGPRSRDAIGGQVERITGRPLEEFLGGEQLARLPLPTLVIHAPDDREVGADSAERYAKSGPHVHLKWAEGLGHRRILSDPNVTRDVVDFIAHRGLRRTQH